MMAAFRSAADVRPRAISPKARNLAGGTRGYPIELINACKAREQKRNDVGSRFRTDHRPISKIWLRIFEGDFGGGAASRSQPFGE
jgi:hypothetical protein